VIGTVTRIGDGGLYVLVPSILPGVELGPLQSVVHRYLDIDTNTPDTDLGTGVMTTTQTYRTTTYLAGDRVMVVEDSLNEYVVTGIVQ
jgi:hypothetical protein